MTTAIHLQILLGVDKKYTKCSNNVLFREMIRKMWPELLRWPINPSADKVRDKIASLLKTLGVYPLLKELKYQISYVRHLSGR